MARKLNQNPSSDPRRTYSASLYFIFLNWIPFFKILVLAFLVFFRIILSLGQVLAHLTCCSSFLISLPPEIQDPQALAHLEGLNFYLSLYEQDPEWVAFIQQELNHNTPLEDIPGRLRLFLMEERTSSMRLDLIQEFISQYARNEAVLPVEPYQLDQAVRSYLDFRRGTDDFSILQAAYQDLRENEGGSAFFFRSRFAQPWYPGIPKRRKDVDRGGTEDAVGRNFPQPSSARKSWARARLADICSLWSGEGGQLNRSGKEYSPNMLSMVQESLRQKGQKKILNNSSIS